MEIIMTEQVEVVTLAEICAELDIKPATARVKLRKHLEKAEGAGFRWVFPVDQKDEIVGLLTKKAAAEEAEGEA